MPGLKFQTRIALLALALAMLTLPSPKLSAQSFYGTIVGTVSDSSGGIIPGATVTVINSGTNEKRSMKTDASGAYRVVNLIPAIYRVEVEMANFKRFVLPSVQVQIDSAVRADAVLQVGETTETIEVSTQTPLLQTESGSVGSQVEGKVVQQMPVNGRNAMNLVALVPGVIPESGSQGAANFNSGNHTAVNTWNGYSISGGISNYSAEFYDGAPMNVLGGNNLGYVPTQDAIQEFKVENSVPSAEYGRFGGGVITMTTKSGTNTFHVSAYEYLRNTILNANFFTTKSTAPYGAAPKAPFHQNQYGVTASGPIKRDKAFFFFSYEKFRIRTGVAVPTNVPGDGTHGTSDMIHGVFFDKIAGKSVTITDPSGKCTGITHNTIAGTWTIPTSCFDPTSVVQQGYSPGPNTNTTPTTTSGQFNFNSSPTEGNDSPQYNARIDYNISGKQHIFGRYTYRNHHDLGQDSFYQYTLPFPTAYGGTNDYNHSFVIGHTYTFNASTILDSRISYLRSQWVNGAKSFGKINLAPFGANYVRLQAGTPGGFTYNALPDIQFSGIHSLYNYVPISTIQLIWWENYALDENLSKIVGNHALKIGGNINRRMHAGVALNHAASGAAVFNNSGNGDEYASFLLGEFANDQAETYMVPATYELAGAAYLTDSWKAAKNLTLNLGIRWETPGGFNEKHDRQTVLLPNVTDPVTGLNGTIATANSPLWPSRSLELVRYDLFSPRVSFAYRLGNSSVVRGGFGMTWLPYDMSLGMMSDMSPVVASITTSTNGAVPSFFEQNPWPLASYPNGIIQPVGHATSQNWTLAYRGQNISSPVPTSTMASMNQYNVAFSHEWRGGWLTEATWAGSKGTHLVAMGFPNGSSFPNNLVSLNQIPTQDYTPSIVDSSNNITSTGGIATVGADAGLSITANAVKSINPACQAWGAGLNKKPTVGQCLLPYGQFQQYNNAASFTAGSHYNALYATMQKRFSSGGTVNANYSYSHMVSDTDQATSGTGTTQDFYNPAAEKSVSTYDLTHRFNLSYVLDLPFGSGKKWLNHGGLENTLAGGWAVNGVTFWQSGFPLPISYNTTTLFSNFGAGGPRPNYVAGCDKRAGVPAKAWDRYQAQLAGSKTAWFNTACFTQPGNFGFGSQPRVDPELRGMSNQNWDLALQKRTTIKERANLEFRAEFFNLFNHTNFASPGSQMNTGSFNTNTPGSTVLPRLVQLSLRVNY